MQLKVIYTVVVNQVTVLVFLINGIAALDFLAWNTLYVAVWE